MQWPLHPLKTLFHTLVGNDAANITRDRLGIVEYHPSVLTKVVENLLCSGSGDHVVG